jgi:HK97 gp10 family phage protein
MGSRVSSVKLQGLTELRKTLSEDLPRESYNAARRATQEIANLVRDEIRPAAPVDTGNLAKSIRAKRTQGTKERPVSKVYADADAFYWKFVEYGTMAQPAHPFVLPVVERMRPMLPELYREKFGKQLEKGLAKKRAKKS